MIKFNPPLEGIFPLNNLIHMVEIIFSLQNIKCLSALYKVIPTAFYTGNYKSLHFNKIIRMY